MNAPARLEGATVWVTGATGFIGSHLVAALLARGCSVHCLVRPTSHLTGLPKDRVRLHTGELSRPETWASCLGQVEHVFHCAGLTQARTRAEYFEANAEACRPLFDACLHHAPRLKSVIHLSSLAAVGPSAADGPVDETTPCHPITHYGQSKLESEKIALHYAGTLPLVVLRPPVVYGPREKNFFTYLRALRRGWCIRVGHTPRALSLIHVQDLVTAMLRAAEEPRKNGPVYFVTDGNVYSWEEVARIASGLLGITPRTIRVPEGVLAFFALLAEGAAWLRKKPALLDRQRVLDLRQSAWTASPHKFFDTYGFRPAYDLEHGLRVTLDWYRQQGWI